MACEFRRLGDNEAHDFQPREDIAGSPFIDKDSLFPGLRVRADVGKGTIGLGVMVCFTYQDPSNMFGSSKPGLFYFCEPGSLGRARELAPDFCDLVEDLFSEKIDEIKTHFGIS